MVRRQRSRLQIAPRVPGEPYSDDDRRLLAVLAPQVAVVVRALELAGGAGGRTRPRGRGHPTGMPAAPPRPPRRAGAVAVWGRAWATGPAGRAADHPGAGGTGAGRAGYGNHGSPGGWSYGEDRPQPRRRHPAQAGGRRPGRGRGQGSDAGLGSSSSHPLPPEPGLRTSFGRDIGPEVVALARGSPAP